LPEPAGLSKLASTTTELGMTRTREMRPVIQSHVHR